jgi:hypothetical protein
MIKHSGEFIKHCSALVLLACLLPYFIIGQASREYDIKAAFLYNFSQYIEWSDIPDDEFRIAVIGHSPITEKLRSIVNGNKFKGKNTVITEYDDLSSVTPSQILYLPSNTHIPLVQVLDKFGNTATLIITEMPGYAEAGSNINFVIVQNRLKFELNVTARNITQFNISSNLLKHAILVKSK